MEIGIFEENVPPPLYSLHEVVKGTNMASKLFIPLKLVNSLKSYTFYIINRVGLNQSGLYQSGYQ